MMAKRGKYCKVKPISSMNRSQVFTTGIPFHIFLLYGFSFMLESDPMHEHVLYKGNETEKSANSDNP
jgi:hypothetical protein